MYHRRSLRTSLSENPQKKIAYPPPFWGIEDSHGADVGTHSSRNADLVMTATAVVSIEINDT